MIIYVKIITEYALNAWFNIFLYPRLSGESPFQGNSDAETLAHVTAAFYEFDEESFEDISEQAKDFIQSLLKKDRRCVKTTHRITIFALWGPLCLCLGEYLGECVSLCMCDTHR